MLLVRRLPSLKCISFPTDSFFHYQDVAPYCKELEELHCLGSHVLLISRHWNQICRLGLSGVIRVQDASVIVQNFPCLTHLSLHGCCLLDNSLSVILDGKKKLIYLDTRHAFIQDQEDYAMVKHHIERAKEWDDQVFLQATGVMELLTCERRNCSVCWWCYKPFF